MRNSKTVLIDRNPGRSAQTVGIARELGTEIDLIHEPLHRLLRRHAAVLSIALAHPLGM